MRIFLALLLAAFTGFAASPPMVFNQFTTNRPGVPVTGNVVIAGTNTAAFYIGNGSLLTGLAGGGDVTTGQLNSSSNELNNLIVSSSNSVRLVAGAASTNAINTSSNALHSTLLSASNSVRLVAGLDSTNAINASSNAVRLVAGVDSTNAINTSSNALHSTLLSASNSVRLVVGVDTTNAINFSSNAVRLVAGLASTNAIDFSSNALHGTLLTASNALAGMSGGGGGDTNHLVQGTNLIGAIVHRTSPAWTNATAQISLGNTNIAFFNGTAFLTYDVNACGFGVAARKDYSTWFGYNAANAQSGNFFTSIGQNAGDTSSGSGITAVGCLSGSSSSGVGMTAIGRNTGISGGTYSSYFGSYSGGAAANYTTYIGSYAGSAALSSNSFFGGYAAGYLTPQKSRDSVIIGFNAGQGNQGFGNVCLGSFSLFGNGGSNIVAAGYNTMRYNSANNVVAIGNEALKYNSNGTNNTAVGFRAGITNRSEVMFPIGIGASATGPIEATNIAGCSNWTALYVPVGHGIPTNSTISISGLMTTAGGVFNTNYTVLATNSTNIVINRTWSSLPLFNITSDAVFSYGEASVNNTFLGADTATNVYHTVGGVYIGNGAGPDTATSETNKLYINNTVGTPLIGGDFGTRVVNFNGTIYNLVGTNNHSTNLAPLTTNIAAGFQPQGLFGYMSFAGTSDLLLSASVDNYTNFTGYIRALTNGFVANLAAGYLTNLVAGYYNVSIARTILPIADNDNDEIETAVFLNDVVQEHIELIDTLNNANMESGAMSHIVYIPANTGISMRLRNLVDTSCTLTIRRANITITTP